MPTRVVELTLLLAVAAHAQNCMPWCYEADCKDSFICGGCFICKPQPPNPPRPPPHPAERCAAYPASRAGGLCEWTADWACPQHVNKRQQVEGIAQDDGSEGFYCCCVFVHPPPAPPAMPPSPPVPAPPPHPDGVCRKFPEKRSGGCAWTLRRGCLNGAKGTEGFAFDDGSEAYYCCCQHPPQPPAAVVRLSGGTDFERVHEERVAAGGAERSGVAPARGSDAPTPSGLSTASTITLAALGALGLLCMRWWRRGQRRAADAAAMPPAAATTITRKRTATKHRLEEHEDGEFAPLFKMPSTPTKQKTDAPLVVALEGNIGIGKSTLLHLLKKNLAAEPGVLFVDEPVHLWERHGLLGAMYTGELSRVAFQLMALSTRYSSLQAALREPGVQLVVVERSIWSDRSIFAAVNLETEAELAAYEASHASLCGDALPELRHATLLLDAPLETIEGRISQRARAQEAAGEGGGGIPRAYLQRLHEAHLDYFAHVEHAKHRIDATGAPEDVAKAVLDSIASFRKEAGCSPISTMEL